MPIYRASDRIVDPQKYPWGYASLGIDSASSNIRLSFNGSSDYIRVGGPVLPEYGDFLIEILVNVPAGASEYHTCFAQGTSNSIWISAHTSAGEATGHTRVFFATGDNLGGSDIRGSGDIIIGVERINDTMNLYENGVLKDSKTNSGYQIGQTVVHFGDWLGSTHRRMIGQIAYISAKQGNNFIGLWPMKEASGNYVYDVSGNGLHGIIYGATWVEI